ncbi:hypothetical protein O6H91_Y003100 [Diphasiastrum complanatum]|nr:hypothetical protein O6H91_Y003100 [Diphasiastrum complanatum]
MFSHAYLQLPDFCSHNQMMPLLNLPQGGWAVDRTYLVLPNYSNGSCERKRRHWNWLEHVCANYNPRDIVANIRHLLKDEPLEPMEPWYKGFKGTIERSATKENGITYTITGIIEQLNETTVKISELPVRKWTQGLQEYLESLMLGNDKIMEPFIKDYREHNTDTRVHFEGDIIREKYGNCCF